MSKNWHFPKGLNPWFLFKNSPFSNFFLGNMGRENVFYDNLERKNAFQSYKKKKFKQPKNWDFFPWFWSKNGEFSNFFF